MTRILIFGFISIAIIFSTAFGTDLKRPERGFVSSRPAENWEQALISGNGTIGALVMSKPHDEVIIFSHERLFMPWYKILPLVDLKPHINKIRELINDGKYAEAARLGVQISDRHGYNVESVHYGMRWPDPFVPAFDLSVKMGAGGISEYGRTLDWQTGVAKVRWTDDKGEFSRRLFVSRADDVAVRR
jgi:alpha-L-fucosidase 2